MALFHLSATAQADGNGPSAYELELASSPKGACTFNRSQTEMVEAGDMVFIEAWVNHGFEIKAWIDDKGDTVSTSQWFEYEMPQRNVKLTLHLRYNPISPDNPESQIGRHKLVLQSKPKGACGFNYEEEVKMRAGDESWLWASLNSGFQFLHWEDEKGKIISTDQEMLFRMPDNDVTLYAVCKYAPEGPANPGANSWDSESGMLIVDDFRAGNLSDAIWQAIGGSPSDRLTHLIVSGKTVRYDFSILQYGGSFPNCATFDLSRTTGVTSVPSWCFDSNQNLNHVLLPVSIENIESYAFAYCTGLSQLTCLSVVPPTLGDQVFEGVPTEGLVVYVPLSSMELYQNADGWKDMVVMPIRSDVANLELNLPEECKDGRYKNMSLELVNVKNGQRYKYVITDRINYIFSNLPKGTVYNASVKNLTGIELARIDSIFVEEDMSCTFGNLLTLQNVKLRVLSPEGADVTSQVTIAWADNKGQNLSHGASLNGMVEGQKLAYSVILPQELGMVCVLPEQGEHVVAAGENVVTMQLVALPMLNMSGRVTNSKTKLVLGGANVAVVQTINGRYTKTFNVQTDAKGRYSLGVYSGMPAVVTVSAEEYVSQVVELADSALASSEVKLSDVVLKPIVGVTIDTRFTFTTSVAAGQQPEVRDWYEDYANVAYTVFNKTTGQYIKEFNVQFPKIVLLETVAEGSELEVTATSKLNAFNAVKATCKVDDNLDAAVTLPIVQQGGIAISFASTENSSVTAMLYDAHDNFVQKYKYSSALLNINNLPDGEYTIVSMGESTFFNSIYNLSSLQQSGLVEGTDYIKNKVKVESGMITSVKNVLIPFFDESKLYYTGQNTAFTVNKTSIIAGNFLTLQAKVDFKEAFRHDINGMELVFELPEGSSFVENSLMVGTQLSVYEKEKNSVSVKLDGNQIDRVRFCVVPTVKGKYSPNAYVRFTIGGKQVTQPIGNVTYEVKNHTINLPSVICRENVTVSGNATGRCKVEVYDGQQLIGRAESLPNGAWRADCKLNNPYNLSTHQIHAKIITKEGLEMQTETKECLYDINAVEVAKVTMYNTSHRVGGAYEEKTVFDFQNPASSIPAYWYWPDYPDFTFTIDFTNNDPALVSNVKLWVETCKGKQVPLKASYNARKGMWVASGKFGSWSDYDIPANVSVDFDCNTKAEVQAEIMEESLNKYAINQDAFLQDINSLDSLLNLCGAEREKESVDLNALENLSQQVFDLLNRTRTNDILSKTEEEINQLLDRCDSHLSDTSMALADNYLTTALSGLNEYLKGMTFETADAVDTTQLNTEGYEKIEKTDGHHLFIYSSESMFKFIDKNLNVVYTIDLAQASPSLSRALYSARNTEDFGKRMNEYIKTLEGVFDRLRTYIQNFADVVEKINSGLIKANELLGNDLADLDASIKYLRANNGNKFLIQMLEAKFDVLAKKVAINDKIITWMETNFPDEKWKIGRLGGGLFAAFDLYLVQRNMVEDLNSVIDLYYSIPNPCTADQTDADRLTKVVWGVGVGAGVYYVSQIVADAVAISSAITGVSAAVSTAGASLSGVIVSVGLVGANMIVSELYAANFQKNIDRIRNQINDLQCDETPENNNNSDNGDDDGGEHKSNNPNVEGVHDPSGFVYEGLESNRLQGVTATCYYREYVTDIYGDAHENIVVWNAEDYQQINPQITDKDGMYRWDVPEGEWQVKFEKEGYQTTYTDWLPVPPPQLEINVGMVQNVNPEVKSAKAYEDGAEIEFTKYMKPETLTADNIYLQIVDGEGEKLITDLTVEFLNQEAVSDEISTQYVSKIALKTEYDLGLVDGEVYVIVNKAVESYAGISMAQTYSQKLDVEKKIREIVISEELNIASDESQKIKVGALPAEASKGKTLVIQSTSSQIMSIGKVVEDDALNAVLDNEGVLYLTLDGNGETEFAISGELLGTAALKLSVVDADVNAQTIVNVVDPIMLSEVKEVTSSRINGSALYRGQTVTLSCETEGATIYYTTDGSCPCEPATRIKYDGKPIPVNGEVTIKAMAVGLNGSKSEMKEYSYSIRQTQLELSLKEGWNWTSHNKAAELSASEFEKESIARVISQTNEIFNDPVLGFVGRLGLVAAHQSVKVNATEETTIRLSGEMYNPLSSNITLSEGWNWLGYPMNQEMTLDEAFAYLNAEEGDYITSLSGGFSQFANGKWNGVLETMAPGEGYLFKSASDKSFIYYDASVSKARAHYGHRLALYQAPWNLNKNRYPNMMCITAELMVGEENAVPDSYFVGAFAGNECRGIGKYVDGVLYLSVYGNGNEKINFVAVDRETEEEFEVSETLTFVADVVGSVNAPFYLHINGATGIEDIESTTSTENIYNIQGQKMNSITQGGIYIVNGKKVIMNNKNRNEKY